MNPAKRRSSQNSIAIEKQRAALIEEIEKAKEGLQKINKKMVDQNHKSQKIIESNMRNQKRLLKYKARIEQMSHYKDSPQHFLSISGYMNQCIQEYIFSHNYNLSINPNEMHDPQSMTYEQLLQLGEQIGKVSKGLSKEQIEKLKHRKQNRAGQSCPICQSEIQLKQIIIELRCGHNYHEQCILLWLKQQNTCPICKEHLVEQKTQPQQKKRRQSWDYVE